VQVELNDLRAVSIADVAHFDGHWIFE
jgi:hypothetical protein